MSKLFKYWLPLLIWMLVIFLFSSMPTVKAAKLYWQEFVIKKSAHIFEYAVFTILLYRAIKAYKPENANLYKIVLTSCILYALTDEFHQSFTPGREPTIRDIFFDVIGGFFGLYIIYYLKNSKYNLAKFISGKLNI